MESEGRCNKQHAPCQTQTIKMTRNCSRVRNLRLMYSYIFSPFDARFAFHYFVFFPQAGANRLGLSELKAKKQSWSWSWSSRRRRRRRRVSSMQPVSTIQDMERPDLTRPVSPYERKNSIPIRLCRTPDPAQPLPICPAKATPIPKVLKALQKARDQSRQRRQVLVKNIIIKCTEERIRLRMCLRFCIASRLCVCVCVCSGHVMHLLDSHGHGGYKLLLEEQILCDTICTRSSPTAHWTNLSR